MKAKNKKDSKVVPMEHPPQQPPPPAKADFYMPLGRWESEKIVLTKAGLQVWFGLTSIWRGVATLFQRRPKQVVFLADKALGLDDPNRRPLGLIYDNQHGNDETANATAQEQGSEKDPSPKSLV
jgi:hypothetical protein